MGDGHKLAEVLGDVVLTRIETDSLVIPTMPEVATEALAMLKEEDVDLASVARLIERDPVIAARLLRQASSAANGTEKTPTIQQAATRLGSESLRTLILDATTRQLFQSRDPRIADLARSLWEHSVAVGLLSRDVAALVDGADPEAAYLGGLIHDVGKPIAAAILLELERVVDPSLFELDADGWLVAVQDVHRTIGVALAEKWELPDAVAAGVRDSSEFDNTDREAVSNLVCFSNSVAKLQDIYPGTYEKEDAEAMVMIGRSLLGLEEDVIERLAGGLKARVAQDAH